MALPVKRLNARFEGEFFFQGYRYSVPFTLPGDLVQFQIQRRGRRMSIKVIKIERAETPAADVPISIPFCAHHGQCGGCRAQHLEYDFQLELKTAPVVRAMTEHFGIVPELRPAPLRERFRGRMDFVVNGDAVGLRPAGDFANFVDINTCPVQSALADRILKQFRERLAESPGLAFDRANGSGTIKYLTIRSGPRDAVAVLTTESARQTDSAYRAFVHRLRADLPEECGLVETFSVWPADVSCVEGGTALAGNGEFTARLGGRDFQVPYDAFFQPNPTAFDVLLDWCFAALETRWQATAPSAPATLVDLYAGMGVLSALFAGRFPGRFNAVRGFDFTASATARAGALFPEAVAARFATVDLNHPPADLFAFTPAPDLIVIDPPRAGLSPDLARIIARDRPAPLILYISCNPTTQIRDLRDFLSTAYRPLGACLVDCFPYTPHLEQALLLERI